MMPSSQKQQQQKTVAANGVVTTTTTTTTRTAPVPVTNTNFSKVESGTSSFVRTVEKSIADMNQKKSEATTTTLPGVTHEASDIPDDLTFGSTYDPSNLPERILKIIKAHGLEFSQGDRVVHIPGARYFSFVKQVGDQKNYETFSVDEEIADEIEPEPEPELVPEIESIPVTEPVIEIPTTSPTITDPFVSPIVLAPTVSQPATNTLGTIGAQIVSPIPDASFNAGMFESPFAAITPAESIAEPVTTVPLTIETVSQPEPRPTVIVPITEIPPEREPVFSTEFNKEPETIVSSIDEHVSRLEKKLKETRIASNREREAYYASHYRDRVTGKFNELFGNNSTINNELFKTMDDYEHARHDLLVEMGTKKIPFHEVIKWMKQEQKELITMLSHEKYGIYTKLAALFKLPVPSVIETRTGMLSLVVQPSTPTASTLGIEIPHDVSLWKNLFDSDRALKLSITNNVSQPLSYQVQPEITTPIQESSKPSVNKSQLYSKLHDSLAQVFGLNTTVPVVKQEPAVIIPTLVTHVESPVMDSVPITDVVTSIPLTFNPEPQATPLENKLEPIVLTPPISSSSLMTKQHPEDLFV